MSAQKPGSRPTPGEPDPVAKHISTDLKSRSDEELAEDEHVAPGADDDEEADPLKARKRYSVNPPDIDRAAGGEFAEAHPTDDSLEDEQ